jgi:hypothetical protein
MQMTNIPTWNEIEKIARRACAESIDGTLSFEELADLIGVSVLAAKTIILDAWKQERPIQLAKGELRDLRNPALAGLEVRGERWYRFSFLD